MLHIDQNRSKKWLVVLLLVAVVGAAWWGWKASRKGGEIAGATGPAFPWSKADQSPEKVVGQANKWVELAARPSSPDQRPAFLTEQEWASLQQALRDTPDREHEQARIVEYLRFQKQFQLWQSMRDSPDVAQRHELATDLLNRVPDRLENREMSASEAELVQAALLEDLVPDPQQRQARLLAEKQRLITQPSEADLQAQQKEASQQQDYKRREASIISQWEATPVDQRDHHWLETQLDAARRAAYGGQ